MWKLLLKTLLIFTLATNHLSAAIVGTPLTTNLEDLITCQMTGSAEFYPVGDTRGNAVLTRKEVNRDCNVTTTIQGECIKWEDRNRIQSVPMEAYDTYDDSDFTDTIGGMFATIGAYDQMEHLWSGYRGYCISGTLQDFDWVQDPMFWASMVMSYLMAGGEAGSLSEGYNETVKATGKAAVEDSMAEAVNMELSEWAEKEATDMAYDFTRDQAAELVKSRGVCLVSGSVNAVTALADGLSGSTGTEDPDCNPIDEICEDEEDTTVFESVKTIDVQMFEDMVDQFAQDGKNLYDYIEVIDDGSDSGVVSYKWKNSHEVEGADTMSVSEMEDLKEDMENMKLFMSLGAAGAQMAACFGSGAAVGSGGTQTAAHDGDRASVETGLNAAVGLATSFIPPPAGPIVGAIAKLVVAFAMSFQDVDSCHDEEDAQQQGSRHEKTYKALKYDLCKPIYDTCEDDYIWGGCALTGFHSCCYDQLLTKVLILQIKAQLGRDYKNCTGISLRDLNYVSFRQCTETEMSQGTDGASAYGLNYDPTSAFQYKFHCVDMTEFKDYLKDMIGENIDMDQFEDFWNNLTIKDPV
jgi:hypothetical protein